MIDTHAHINTDIFKDDIDNVIRRAIDNGVEKIIIPAIEPKDFDNLLQLVNKYSQLYCGIGVHPHNVKDIGKLELDLVDKLSENKKVVAIGEIGIDYFYDFAPKKKQKEMFDAQIKIAKIKNLPIIVHNREADDDVLDIIKSNQDGNLKGVLHCFSSDLETLKKSLDLGFNVSFTGNITFKKVDMVEVIKYIPNDRFMIETDSPYMAPVPMRGKRNEPSYVKFIAEKIAEIKEMKINDIINYSTENAIKLFKLCTFLTLFFISSYVSYSQDDVYYETDEESEVVEKPKSTYDKLLGIGGMFGTTTIVESQFLKEGTRSVSYEGFLGYGGELSYGLFDNLLFRFNYVYAANKKVQEDAKRLDPNSNIPPNIHQMFELTANYIPNPNNKINFIFTGGVNYFINNINKKINQKMGITFGLGVIGNIWNSEYGLLSVMGEFRVNTEFNKVITTVFVARDDIRQAETMNLYSMPRFSIIFYPKF